jgi:hypothetical protein
VDAPATGKNTLDSWIATMRSQSARNVRDVIPLQDARDVAEHVELSKCATAAATASRHAAGSRRRAAAPRTPPPLDAIAATVCERGVVCREDARALGGESQRRRPTDPGCSASAKAAPPVKRFMGADHP